MNPAGLPPNRLEALGGLDADAKARMRKLIRRRLGEARKLQLRPIPRDLRLWLEATLPRLRAHCRR
jgi:hypothetical protein